MEKFRKICHWINTYSGAIQAGASILTLIIMGAIAYFTWQATDSAAIASKAASDIAARQLSLQERQQRARLSVIEAKLVPSGLLQQDQFGNAITPPTQLYRLEAKIKNSGVFPARNAHLAIASSSIGVLDPESRDVGLVEAGQELIIASPTFSARGDFDSVAIAFALSFREDGSGKCRYSLPQQGRFISVGQSGDQPSAYELQFQGITPDELRPSNPSQFMDSPASKVLNEVQGWQGSVAACQAS
ncbi:MAG: hypothetical protein ACJ8GM_13785 [Paraburkholderia fungorum]